MKQAEALGEELLRLGRVAAGAVAKGLRTQGRWREVLLPFAEQFVGESDVRDTLMLLAKRKIDPLAPMAAQILRGETTAFEQDPE